MIRKTEAQRLNKWNTTQSTKKHAFDISVLKSNSVVIKPPMIERIKLLTS